MWKKFKHMKLQLPPNYMQQTGESKNFNLYDTAKEPVFFGKAKTLNSS